MIKRFKEFKELNEAEVDAQGNLIGFDLPQEGTEENPIEISKEEYLYLSYPEFMGQSRTDEDGNYKMLWRVGETYYLTRGNIFD